MTLTDNNHQTEYGQQQTQHVVPKKLALLLYTSHFLSTWNSRLFEFGAVLFLADIFPDTLLPMSVYALMRCAAAIVFAHPVGQWIDTGNRLTVVRTSILGRRVAITISCALFWGLLLLQKNQHPGTSPPEEWNGLLQKGLFSLTVLLACVEKLCSVMNLVSVERDWVVVIAGGNDEARVELNAKMRRIDLLCKLLGPLAISTISIVSTLAAIWTTLVMNLLSVVFEYPFIRQVYGMVPELQRQNPGRPDGGEREEETRRGEQMSEEEEEEEEEYTAGEFEDQPFIHSERRLSRISGGIRHFLSRLLPLGSLPFYFTHRAFLPSFSLSLLYLTVLSFSGQMITYLISVGYTPFHVGLVRTVSTMFELSATWVAPRLIKKIGDIRAGIWSLSWQMVWLAGGVALLFADVGDVGDEKNWWKFPAGMSKEMVSATGLAVGVALSRVGLWAYDLCAQNIIQEVCLFPSPHLST